MTSMGMGLTIEGLLEFADMNPELGSRVVVNMHPRGKGYICTPLKTYTHTRKNASWETILSCWGLDLGWSC